MTTTTATLDAALARLARGDSEEIAMIRQNAFLREVVIRLINELPSDKQAFYFEFLGMTA